MIIWVEESSATIVVRRAISHQSTLSPRSIKIETRTRARQPPARRRTSRTMGVPMLVSGSPTTIKMKMMNKRRKKIPPKMKKLPESPSSVKALFLHHPCASWLKEVPRRRSKTQGRAHRMKQPTPTPKKSVRRLYQRRVPRRRRRFLGRKLPTLTPMVRVRR